VRLRNASSHAQIILTYSSFDVYIYIYYILVTHSRGCVFYMYFYMYVGVPFECCPEFPKAKRIPGDLSPEHYVYIYVERGVLSVLKYIIIYYVYLTVGRQSPLLSRPVCSMEYALYAVLFHYDSYYNIIYKTITIQTIVYIIV